MDLQKKTQRKVKFRAWDKSKKEFIEPAYVLIDGLGNPFSSEHRTPAPFVLMQYTGLKDKNGKEIYEGDKVIWKQATGGFLPSDANEYTCEIVWDRTGWACREIEAYKDDYHSQFTLSPEHIKIIGNLYQNPELLT